VYRRLTPGLALLRATGCAALLVLIWNPISSRLVPGATPPLVLLDVSLSMAGHGGQWREALDSARALAKGGGVIWRFGAGVAAFDSLPPTDGTSRLAPALAAAAGHGAPAVVVTDGAIADLARIAPDLLRRPRIVVLPRRDFPDAFVAAVEGTHRIAATDTLRLKVSYGTAGMRETGSGMRHATLAVTLEGRRLASRDVPLPDSGILSTELPLPASRIPHPGWSALDVRLEGVRADSEPRDDARRFVVEVNPSPAIVVLAAPPDWDLRFLARTLADVARVPLEMFVETAPGAVPAGGRWRDAATLAPVPVAEVKRALARARLVVQGGDPAGFGRVPVPGAVLLWPTRDGQEGDWYVQPPPASPLTPALAGLAWDSLPPVVSLAPVTPESGSVVALTALLARRGSPPPGLPPRPVVLLSERAGVRRAEIAAAGLYRWAFRGGASAVAYRTFVAALADWLLAGSGGDMGVSRAVPEALAVANGLPLPWRWTGPGAPRDLGVTLAAGRGGVERLDTLRFDASGAAELRLPPGVYRYALAGGPERGMVAVETYSDEWRPAAPALHAQSGAPAGRFETVSMRDHWWLFVVAIAAFTAEWAWRRRQGLP
jgi:hypothetical protein